MCMYVYTHIYIPVAILAPSSPCSVILIRMALTQWVLILGAYATGAAVRIPPPLRVLGETVQDVVGDNTVVRDLDLAEFMCGIHILSDTFTEHDLNAAYYDRKLDPRAQDILLNLGWQAAKNLALRVKVGGMGWFSPECSWWVFASSAQHERNKKWSRAVGYELLTAGPRVEGNSAYRDVRDANKVARRVRFLMEVLYRRGAHPFLEQPKGSQLILFPVMTAMFFGCGTWYASRANMCNYLPGDPSEVEKKEFELWSTAWWVVLFGNKCTHGRSVHVNLMDRCGKWFTGNARLKKSEQYPKLWTNTIKNCYMAYHNKPDGLNNKMPKPAIEFDSPQCFYLGWGWFRNKRGVYLSVPPWLPRKRSHG